MKGKIHEGSNFKDLFSLLHDVTTSNATDRIMCIQGESCRTPTLKGYADCQLVGDQVRAHRLGEGVASDVRCDLTCAPQASG